MNWGLLYRLSLLRLALLHLNESLCCFCRAHSLVRLERLEVELAEWAFHWIRLVSAAFSLNANPSFERFREIVLFSCRLMNHLKIAISCKIIWTPYMLLSLRWNRLLMSLGKMVCNPSTLVRVFLCWSMRGDMMLLLLDYRRTILLIKCCKILVWHILRDDVYHILKRKSSGTSYFH